MEEEHKQRIIHELHELLRGGYCEDSISSVVDIDVDKRCITIKFNYNVVPEDDYVGLAHY